MNSSSNSKYANDLSRISEDAEESKNSKSIFSKLANKAPGSRYVTFSVHASENFRVSLVNTNRSVDKDEELAYKNVSKILQEGLQSTTSPSTVFKKLLKKRSPTIAYAIYTQFRANLFKLMLTRKSIKSDEIGEIQVDETGLIVSGLPDIELTDLKLPCELITDEVRKEIEFFIEHEIYIPNANLHRHLSSIYLKSLTQTVNAILAQSEQNLNGLLYSVSMLNELSDHIKSIIIEVYKPSVLTLYNLDPTNSGILS